MSQADWSTMDDSLDVASVRRGVSAGFPRPNGGGSFAYGYGSRVATPGAVGHYSNEANFAPTPDGKGGVMELCVQRGVSGGTTGFSGGAVICAQGPSVNDEAYLLGLSDADPCHIMLKKGVIGEAISDALTGPGILRRSTATIAIGEYVHLKLEAIVNKAPGGEVEDVILKAWRNDLTVNPVTAPVWEAIPGIDDVIDDILGASTGSPPFTSGYMGRAAWFSGVSRRVYFDHVRRQRQTT